jgi:uncharacterized protein YigA (DUF484 family)
MNLMRSWEPDDLPPDALQALLGSLRVPANQVGAVTSTLVFLFAEARRNHRFEANRWRRQEAREQIERIAKRCADLQSEMARAGDLAKVWLGVQSLRRQQFGETTDDAARRFQ